MNTSTARDYWIQRFDFEGREVRCVIARRCQTLAGFQIGWRFDKKIQGKLIEQVVRRPGCERHARLFAMKKGLIFPKSPQPRPTP